MNVIIEIPSQHLMLQHVEIILNWKACKLSHMLLCLFVWTSLLTHEQDFLGLQMKHPFLCQQWNYPSRIHTLINLYQVCHLTKISKSAWYKWAFRIEDRYIQESNSILSSSKQLPNYIWVTIFWTWNGSNSLLMWRTRRPIKMCRVTEVVWY
jgi:hypothetical protein